MEIYITLHYLTLPYQTLHYIHTKRAVIKHGWEIPNEMNGSIQTSSIDGPAEKSPHSSCWINGGIPIAGWF